ncbi:hypothetical protein XELAEV_18020882mg [Xenopus laevis]|uniref:Uncharacterized protein n=1 Tax=Xenopus laevis TaxID=8355 RepID=A0A974HR27_XENLA|nr:hypothetical protein XELAEV_18020882mg [Xenopus laevis]
MLLIFVQGLGIIMMILNVGSMCFLSLVANSTVPFTLLSFCYCLSFSSPKKRELILGRPNRTQLPVSWLTVLKALMILHSLSIYLVYNSNYTELFFYIIDPEVIKIKQFLP